MHVDLERLSDNLMELKLNCGTIGNKMCWFLINFIKIRYWIKLILNETLWNYFFAYERKIVYYNRSNQVLFRIAFNESLSPFHVYKVEIRNLTALAVLRWWCRLNINTFSSYFRTFFAEKSFCSIQYSCGADVYK